MKLSDIKGERTIDAVADIIEYIGELTEDESTKAIFTDIKGKNREEILNSVVKHLPTMLRMHKNAVYGIFTTISGNADYIKTASLVDMINDIRELLSDDCFTDLFQSAQNGAPATLSVSAPLNIVDIAPED